MKIQLESVNENSIRKWKKNVQLEIGKKVYENNENWEMAEQKKAVCKTARRAHSQ